MHNSTLLVSLLCLATLIPISAFSQDSLRTFPLGENTVGERQRIRELWLEDGVFNPPATFEAPDQIPYASHAPEGRIYPVFFDSIPYKGKDTRVFAWVGIPAGASAERPAPGIVLVHGGGGTAYREWVRTWIKRGFAAIAIDTQGAAPQYQSNSSFVTHAHADAGPSSAGGGFIHSLEPVQEQWPYHAVAAIIKAHSLLRELPQTDPERIGITGISWGSVLTSIAIAADHRFRFAVLVYGCGYMGVNSYRQPNVFQQLPPQAVQRWIDLWDPSGHLDTSLTPNLLFINGTNDPFFPTDSWVKSVYLAQSNPAVEVAHTLRVAMPHGHPPAGDPPEVLAYANAAVNDEPALVKISDSDSGGGCAWVTWHESTQAPIHSAQLVYTEDSGEWVERRWQTIQAAIYKGASSRTEGIASARADATIPPNATVFYFNLENASGSITSSFPMGKDAPRAQARNQ